MADSNWATTGKRWLPLSELLKQTTDGDRVIEVVIYRVLFDHHDGGLYPSLEKAQAECARMTSDPLDWKQSGYAPTFEWEARDSRDTNFTIVSVVIETNPIFPKEV